MNRYGKILVVDDEDKITEVLEAYLTNIGYEVVVAHNGKDAIELFKYHNISLVILDLMLPDIMGEEVCKIIRMLSRTPIIMLTAKTEETDLIQGLKIGADDYIMKPFSPRTVVAKVEAVLRRTESDQLSSIPVSFNKGYLFIDFQNGIIKIQGEDVLLTPTEYKILTTMAKAPNRTFTRNQLISYALADDFDGYDRSIDTYIKGIRQKIEPDCKNPQLVITVRGLGYKFEATD
ncbi:MAG: response regulator transcription factor [Mobilitalea sp.]